MMKNNIFYIVIVFVICISVYYLVVNDDSNIIALNDNAVVSDKQTMEQNKLKYNVELAKTKLNLDDRNTIDKKNLPPIKVIESIIDRLPEHELNSYFNKFFPNNGESLANITDKTAFAKNLAREFLDESPTNNNQTDGYSTIHFSISKDFSEPETTNIELPDNPNFKIYAHLELNVAVNNNAEIFVKWINLDTNETLLFKKKNINPSTNKNWVSFTPSTGWKAGSYLVKLYRFESSLNVIAQNSYIVYDN